VKERTNLLPAHPLHVIDSMDVPASIAVTLPSQITKPSPHLRVLVVDDDADSREMLEDAVRCLGHVSVGARGGVEALAKQQADPVDVILSDWSMHGMSGVELCRHVRSHESSEYTYFLFMTGFGDRAHLLEGLRAGADDYLTKPVDLEELEVRLLSAARVIVHQRQLAELNATLRQENDISFEAARIDPLTQIANRLRLCEDLDALHSHAARYGHRYCAALCDIDLFKSYNDRYGHLAGDEALRRVAVAMRGALRRGDTLYRYGGDEFLIILYEQGITEARQAMDRVRRIVESLGVRHDASPTGVVTLSAGVAEIGDANASCDDWLRLADSALYRAKQHGRNRVEKDEAADAAHGKSSPAAPPLEIVAGQGLPPPAGLHLGARPPAGIFPQR
jgi:two-component system cell cycle response regulator